ncbi:LytTR family DNA-binding domain-containing protein [Dyadobacter sp. CY261]|uniref:LytR/AlgR family response regulator transcription factor n=1 Tax=Dyadobacter sp. CY261 TaxID=2907203 RepID=UPI001F24154D|nr:LytTR family DNA-binding domain-containing protein [Dyadobacter sp. CY261]MCF0068851.1 LytTR family DNA-binding domain-containing protein [Dyadobacter sp. CY261]
MRIHTLIVDDEPHAIEIMERLAAHVPEIEIIATCSNAIKAYQLLQTTQVDLIFLDIKMPGLSGTDLVRSLNAPPMVVLTTAYPEHAMEGFELNVVDYLLKPISLSRFLRAADKILFTFKGIKPIMQDQPEAEPPKEHYLYLRVDRRYVKVNTNDIHWIESVKDYLKVVTGNEVFISKQKISLAEKLLPTGKFMRIHRSFIVPLDKVERLHPNHVIIDGHRLPVGRNYKEICIRRFLPEETDY